MHIRLSIMLDHLPGGAGSATAASCIGFLCAGLSILGPDHLCALFSLTTSITPKQALAVGGSWGLAHCTGTVIVCVIFNIIRTSYLRKVDPEQWEKYGDYFIGFSLIACSAYFTWRESHYLTEHADGSVTVEACACHPPPAAPELEPDADVEATRPDALPEGSGPPRRPRRERSHSRTATPPPASQNDRPKKQFRYGFCDAYGECFTKDCGDAQCEAAHESEGDVESAPLLPQRMRANLQHKVMDRIRERYYGGAMIGFLQGLCCPMVFVSLNMFSSYVSTAATTGVFVASYVFASTVGTALLASGWVCLVESGLGSKISPKIVYRSSCCFTMVFGILWCFANHYDALKSLDSHEWLHQFAETSLTAVAPVAQVTSH